MAIRLDKWKNIKGVRWSAGQLGHLEVWMDLRTPYYRTDDPSGQPNSPAWSYIEARVVSPERSDYVQNDNRDRGTDPNNDNLDWEWVEHQTSGDWDDGTDLIMTMPAQSIVDDHFITQAGMHRIWPFGVTGGNVSEMTQGGACNFLLNWQKIKNADFFGLPHGTPQEEWPPLRVELYGSVMAVGPRLHTVHTQFRLLDKAKMSNLIRVDPDDWLEITYNEEVAVLEESNRVERTYSAFFDNFHLDKPIEEAREHFATLVYNWAPATGEDRVVIE